jgi:hypothetical protein
MKAIKKCAAKLRLAFEAVRHFFGQGRNCPKKSSYHCGSFYI